MNFLKYRSSWQFINLENRWLKLLIFFLLLIVMMLTVIAAKREVIVALVPPTLNQRVELKASVAQEAYLSSWALYFAELIGNVTPGNVTFIEEALSPMLSPDIYQHVVDVLRMQTKQIKEDSITLSFQPRQIEQDDKTGKIYVTGYAFLAGVTGKTTRELRTYEFLMRVENYAPILIWMDTYVGQPKFEK